jgi:hypothetical protein
MGEREGEEEGEPELVSSNCEVCALIVLARLQLRIG